MSAANPTIAMCPRRNVIAKRGLAVSPRKSVRLLLIGFFVSSCADKTTAVRVEQQSHSAPVPAHSATVPDRLLGVLAMGETPCALPINTDADGVLVVSEKKMQ